MSKNITNGIALECKVFNELIGVEKDLILINYTDFDFEQTSSIYNRQVDDSLGNNRGLTDIFLKAGASKYIFEGTDYSVLPTVTPEVREDGEIWFSHSIQFTIYSKKSSDRETILSLGGATVIAVTREKSTGLYELFGMYQGLKVSDISRTYTGAQNSNFYQVTIATPEIAVIKEPSLSELSIYLDGGIILPPAPTPGVYGDATPTVQGLVRVDSIEANPIVYLKTTIDSLFARKDNILTTEVLLEDNRTSIIKWPSAKAIIDWIVSRYQTIIPTGTITQYYRGDKTWQTLDASTVGLGNVDNTSDLDKPISEVVINALEEKADLVGGLVPSYQLPGYVDDIIEGYLNGGIFYEDELLTIPITGEAGKIYVDITTGQGSRQYRWAGTSYIQITNGLIGSTDDVPEGSSNLYFTESRVLLTLLAGVTFLTNSSVLVTDTIRIGIGKLQAQINFLLGKVEDKIYDEILTSNKQVFTLPISNPTSISVYINGSFQYIITTVNTPLVNKWSLAGSDITVTKPTKAGDYIYIIFK